MPLHQKVTLGKYDDEVYNLCLIVSSITSCYTNVSSAKSETWSIEYIVHRLQVR